ncbi:hypothetical protein DL96DRAFT_1702409 [Flagelloscypha sp. PMI_526]|nr:hypothetical protein DL96DRAFT_1702409 [Flagelloscypha sp. PMI_526]
MPPLSAFAKLSLDERGFRSPPNGQARLNGKPPPSLEHKSQTKLQLYASSVPYSIEPESKMMELLDLIVLRLSQCAEARDFDPGFVQWDSMLTYWMMLKYPLPKDKRIAIARLYFHIALLPGISMQTLAMVADGFKVLTRSKNKLTVDDLRLPWKPIYDLLNQDLFLSRRQFEYTQLSWCMGYMAENSRRFFHPAAIPEMLTTFLPSMNGTNIDTMLATQYYLTTFLPLTHPQLYLPMLFRVWESVNSYMYDERMLAFLAKLSELHVAPSASDPRKVDALPDDARSEGEERPAWALPADMKAGPAWSGIFKDVGMFTQDEWDFLMCKVLASMADGGSLTTGPTTDSQVSFEINRLPKPNWRIPSLAKIIVYSMAPDGTPAPSSNAPTPFFTPLPSGLNTPTGPSHPHPNLSDYLSASLSKTARPAQTKPQFIAGCHALDSLAKLIASMESFFHPTNSGGWTTDLSAFVKYLVADFNKRWHEEQKPDCKTPLHRRLTKTMKRELVKSLRNCDAIGHSMATMEPDLILHPVLERAVPALETLTETERTLAVIKALGAVAPALVCRRVYYSGAKFLVPILQLLIPGIDLHRMIPRRLFAQLASLLRFPESIKFSDLAAKTETNGTGTPGSLPSTPGLSRPQRPKMASFPSFEFRDEVLDSDVPLTSQEEDDMLRDTTTDLPDWVANLIRRVILLLENLPEESANGTSGGTTEIQVVDAVMAACNQICSHLSEPLYNLVLNIVFDYASTNVRPNAVRAMHQLVECVANANAPMTLGKFFDFCDRNIRIELENGASSIRTTQVSKPPPSDATLHWNLAILRGTVYNDGNAILAYKDRWLSLLQLLHERTLSKRGYSWTGKLLSSMLLTLTHTYPLENRFVNPEEWNSADFQQNHHRYWGKLYKPDEVTISWHVPSEQEIEFTLVIFRDLVAPALHSLRMLLQSNTSRDMVWRNEFCRHLSLVRNAFSGIPTLCKEYISDSEQQDAIKTSDILHEIPEMIASCPPIRAGFCLTDPRDSRYQYIQKLRVEFGEFLHEASVNLLSQGQENTVDAVQMLVRSIRTFMMEYADSRDSYFVNEEQLTAEKNVARQYINQKEWPRSVYTRKARFYHSARMRWNAVERLRGPLQDQLIDDVVQWSMWNYAVVRETAQSVLEAICSLYDGVRRRALPVLYASLTAGHDDDRVKGALWTLNGASFGRYATSEHTLVPEFAAKLFACQVHEKPSIQEIAGTLSDNCLTNFTEPSFLYVQMASPILEQSISELQALLPAASSNTEKMIAAKCTQKTLFRVALSNDFLQQMTEDTLQVALSSKTHWKYLIVATRLLRTLVRLDTPTSAPHTRYFLENMHSHHATIRYVGDSTSPFFLLALKYFTGKSTNPLLEDILTKHCHDFTLNILRNYKVPYNPTKGNRRPIFRDRDPDGWSCLKETLTLYQPPDEMKSTFLPWQDSTYEALEAIRSFALDSDFWQSLSFRYSEETNETSLSLDHVSCVKSLFQLLEDEPLDLVKSQIEKLLLNKKPDVQRAAAELLAGTVGGSKHWPVLKQNQLWDWFSPQIPVLLSRELQTDTLPIWTSFVEYIFHQTDPRRVQPLIDFILESFRNLDYNAEMTFDIVKTMNLFRAVYEEMGWKFKEFADDAIQQSWGAISNHHDDVRGYISELLAFSEKIKWQPQPSTPSPESFVTECRVSERDVMQLRGVYHVGRVNELVEAFQTWRPQRLPGTRALHSTYDRVGVTVCKWLFQSLHDIHALSVYDYILPLIPELLRFTELNDHDDLAVRANSVLVRMCGVIPPSTCVIPVLDAIFKVIQNSPSWRVRLKALPLIQVFYFRLVPLISEIKIVQILEVLCQCLDDEVVEVREMAATTLSAILRLSPRRSVITLKDRFVRLAQTSRIPTKRSDSKYSRAIRQRHAAVLGICALIESYPYTIERWMPQLLTETLAEMAYDPIPISTAVRKCASNFKKTHQDTWHEDCRKFNEEQLTALSTLLTGSSYCK